MAQDTTPALILYVGDGSQTRFEVPFDKGAYGEIKVAFVRRGLTDYTYNPDTYTVDGYLYAWNGGVYTKTEAVDTDTPLYDKNGEATGNTWTAEMYREPKNDIFTQAVVEWTGDALTTNDVICIVRDTVKDQPYSYPNNQKHIERALDNLARQIQELQLTADNALKVDPSWNYTMNDPNKMDPITWLQTIVRSKDQTLREVRVDNDYIMYSTDDPDAEAKTWNVLAGVKTGNAGVVSHIRETKVLAEDGVTYIPFLEYSVDGGNSWKSAGQAASALEYQYVRKSGDTMTGTLWFQMASTIYKVGISVYDRHSMRFASATYGNGSFTMDFQNATLKPQLTDYAHIGTSSLRWADAYINKVYTGVINNGYDIAVPVTSEPDIFALKSDISAAINAGKMITEQGFWYAKMDSATVPPTAEDGTNYADFSQVDGQGNPIIVTYTRVNGVWVQDQTIVPPADEDGYVLITSKIWDIPEQTGQQGGRVLWNHVSKQFTPYPTIISFDNINVTGNSNVIMPQNPGNNQIVNKDYVDNKVKDSTITITQGGVTKGSFSVNQDSDSTIEIDAGATGGHECVEFQVPTSQNNYVWYRKYADGWVEQGGYTTAANPTITLPVTMADTNYCVYVSGWEQYAGERTLRLRVDSKSTTAIHILNRNNKRQGTGTTYWEVKGMMAESEMPSYNSGGGSAIGGGGAGGPEDD